MITTLHAGVPALNDARISPGKWWVCWRIFDRSSLIIVDRILAFCWTNDIPALWCAPLFKMAEKCRDIESAWFTTSPTHFINMFNKDRCSIPMGTTVRLGPLKFSLRVTIDHHGPSTHSGHYTASISCCEKHSIATITPLRSLELLITKTPLLHMLYYMNWLTYDFWTRTGRWEFDRSHGAGTSSPSHWQQVEEQAPKPVGWMMFFLLTTFVQKVCVNIYIYAFSIWVLL